ncbi:MAG: 5-amino-6-(D-ribitylamino)uracil--L-tyrosine 4-hydroxyphenyl transferase CofH [Methanosarcinales archaeon]|jgi:FO synthase subunit 2|nr:5-amino-6-(D-ribitylamino)uracil--L-tyrosine 4-hydroxyphenyl transferase CofH [Methanosarcinales archaeon]
MDVFELKNRDISKSECLELFENDNLFFDTLKAADELRKDICGDTVTYILNANLNFTNICNLNCGFCAFKVKPRDENAYVMTPEQVGKKALAARKAGAMEVCVQGGIRKETDTHLQVEMVKSILKETAPYGGISIHGFSPMEIHSAAETAGLDLKTAVLMLKEAGLDTTPGTSAEILVDDVRKNLCPGKLSVKEWVKTIKTIHKTGLKTTSTIMYGHIENNEDRVDHLFRLKRIQEETGGFTEFIPLTYLHENTPLYRKGIVKSGASGLDDLRMYAVPRLLFKESLPNIQVAWVKLGAKFCQVGLRSGANDFGGTLMEDTISKAAGSQYGTSMEQKKIEECIRQIGRKPQLRTTTYNYVDEAPAKRAVKV